ncbi:hypothetical protein JR316_0002200 [Psilocybe cubensis]|uniref:Uncharacterized protein n=1 Tax=Psilocybe cubensis TaxID=181762 RepID=A0ACB8HCB1_PSICU|nr:hypothetical protein JR316_0002200 [Psilocybe cubensis]KAH9485292.1 hypothetical protein JR316_0002200 [Psilocybe cubensis]
MVLSKDELWENGHDETVEVNQRALIDKVLARYSGEFTVFRELLQNSDDAQSKSVEIRFETQAYVDNRSGTPRSDDSLSSSPGQLPDLKTSLVHHWVFKNNGNIFRDEDWNRLKKIAEGNPDEEKIGAFGVGFYSLFSVTEEPFVTSGNKWMGFYWKDKKDQLFARRGELPESELDPAAREWTSFTMTLREATPMPIAFDFTRFLASSLTFMGHLREVCVYYDDKRLVKLNKASGLPHSLGIPKGLKSQSPSGIMTVDDIQSTPLFIQAQVMKWIYTSGTGKKRQNPTKPIKAANTGSPGFFSSLFSTLSGTSTPQRISTAPLPPVEKSIDHLAISETSVSLSIYSASIQVHIDKKLSAELQRSTKKNPPTKMKFELIYTAKDEYDASLEEEAKHPEATGSIFQGLRADLDGQGAARVFIGHSTAQSTGVGGHISARFIPTVERESIDFMDRHVAVWNKELLFIGGFLSRAAYEFELASVQKLWATLKTGSISDDQELQLRATNQVLHALKFFMFYPSTPSPDVSALMESAFFECSADGRFPIISSKGVRDVSTVRLPDPTFSTFLKELPTLPDTVVTGVPIMISALQSRGLIKPINFQDVLQELQSRPLPESEFVACLNWWISIYQDKDRDRLAPIRTQLINSVVLTLEIKKGEHKIISLASIKSFISPRSPCAHIPMDGPLPENVLPNSISKLFKPEVLASSFPWTEFTIVQWVSFICDDGDFPAEYSISTSPPWAERVLSLIIRVWPSLASPYKMDIIRTLRLKACIPTSAGMVVPQEAYFPNVNIFGDLPIVTFPGGTSIKGTAEKVLQEIGVRKHVELQIIFNRMIKTNEWTIADLTKYLVSVKGSLTDTEYQRLRATAAFPKESCDGSHDNGKRVRYTASQLYEPLDIFRTLKLPIIDWGQQLKWKNSSEEARFLFDIGLQRYPPLNRIIDLCASEDSTIRPVALRYLIDNLETRYRDYDPQNYVNIRFIPALKGSEPCLGTIQEVFSAQWAAVGFLVLHPSYQSYASKLKIQDHPPASQLMALLRSKPPGTDQEARELFRLLAGRVNDFKNSDLVTLSTTSFVPITGGKNVSDSTVRWLPPSQCYLSSEGRESFHSKLFVFIDFGTAANAFLTACGTRSQPSVEEVAKILLNSPREFYELSGGPVNFLSELRNLAVNAKAITPGTILRMKRSPILLCQQRQLKRQVKTSDDWDEDDWDMRYDLKKPSEIIVADDTHAYQSFGESLYTAPQEDIIEAFYCQLGSMKLSKVVKEEYKTTVELHNSKTATEVRALILERLPLFLHEHTHARTRVSFSWISANKNFLVKAFGKLGVIKHLSYGNLNLSKSQDASAIARRFGSGPIELWIAGNAQIDIVATSLNRLLFDSPKTNDALLFMTILSTDLRSLKRRGYNGNNYKSLCLLSNRSQSITPVDRILRQQRDARLAAESDRMAKEKEKATQLPPPPLPLADTRPAVNDHPNPDPNELVESKPLLPTNLAGHLQNFRRKIGSMSSSATKPFQPSVPNTDSSSQASEQGPSPRSPGPPTSTNNSDNNSGITPISNISKNIDMAVSSCRSESANLLTNRQQMQRVKESLNDGYCDISGRKGDLHHIGQMGPVKVYLSEEIPNHQAGMFMEEKRHSLARFVYIMKPLATIYDLPLTKLHIFYDLEGGIIAFNRNGSIFLNLRYFEEWHDTDVKNEKLQDAYISWYFTIAHEIAHNLVQPHNSEHEFYFSAICERYLVQLARQLQGSSSTSS